MTKLTDDTGAPLPLVVPCRADAKTYEHRIYLNYAGAKVLADLLSKLMGGQKNPKATIWQNGEEVTLELHTSSQEDFDCGGPRDYKVDRDTLNKLPAIWPVPGRTGISVNQLALDDVQKLKHEEIPVIREVLSNRVSEALQPPEKP